MKFTGLHKKIVETMIEAIKFDQDVGKQILERLIDLVQFHPQFMKPVSFEVLTVVNEIIKNKQFDTSIRNAGLTAVIQLCICNPVGFRASEVFIKQTIPILLSIICEVVDDDMQEWNKDSELVISNEEPYAYT